MEYVFKDHKDLKLDHDKFKTLKKEIDTELAKVGDSYGNHKFDDKENPLPDITAKGTKILEKVENITNFLGPAYVKLHQKSILYLIDEMHKNRGGLGISDMGKKSFECFEVYAGEKRAYDNLFKSDNEISRLKRANKKLQDQLADAEKEIRRLNKENDRFSKPIEMEAIAVLEKFHKSDPDKKHKILHELTNLQDFKVYKQKMTMSKENYDLAQANLLKYKPFKFGTFSTLRKLQYIRGIDYAGRKWVYYGLTKKLKGKQHFYFQTHLSLGVVVKHGVGIQLWATGALEMGTWKNDIKHGSGKYFYSNGDLFEGDFVNGTMDGPALYIDSDGSRKKRSYNKGELISESLLK